MGANTSMATRVSAARPPSCLINSSSVIGFRDSEQTRVAHVCTRRWHSSLPWACPYLWISFQLAPHNVGLYERFGSSDLVIHATEGEPGRSVGMPYQMIFAPPVLSQVVLLLNTEPPCRKS